jgi:hypothetical protein
VAHNNKATKIEEKGKSNKLHSKQEGLCKGLGVLELVVMFQNVSQMTKHFPSQTILQRKALMNFCICSSNVCSYIHYIVQKQLNLIIFLINQGYHKQF